MIHKPGVTRYDGLGGLYSDWLIKKIIQVGCLRRPGLKILDFGCGVSRLKSVLQSDDIMGFDIDPELSELADWRDFRFNVLVSNQVFYAFERHDLELFFENLVLHSPGAEVIVGISNRGILNKVGMTLLRRSRAHSAAKLTAAEEIEVLSKFVDFKKISNFFWLSKIYVGSLKNGRFK